ncbi:5,10-methylenetetrahydrofolate reductase (NAD(P)) [Desulfonatronum thiosulfatophilum]|uniref:Methylenetetrahydrofolate reductase n=1 Tax=Desulfonatronum thiosulfatophilum TaxID=617002 RepID=A0A1G6DP71_9BACT|nr:methylenetetrahydrofolate reductase [NAD(P)H] [Desulfonatronum thiosulfatophilum]SDB46901.1 5,10-methylenetetrahydrofolate reductase (NAD(P)) [Desulfonatronum thiosulfatophilum]
MKIKDMLQQPDRSRISLEFFPPKDRALWPKFFETVERLRSLNPLFVSVTYGAGGSTQAATLDIVSTLKRDFDMEPMAHLTCVGACAEGLREFLDDLVRADVSNIMALRGDPPKGESTFTPSDDGFQHASDLVGFIAKNYQDFGVGVAGYPEGHPEAVGLEEDLRFLKAKLDLGGDFAVTQLFFDNKAYWDFMRKIRDVGIVKPIIPGIMPIFSLKFIQRITSMCGATLPEQFLKDLEQADARGGDAAVQEVGIRHAAQQIQDLLHNGAPGVHLYTMNRSDGCLRIMEQVEQ